MLAEKSTVTVIGLGLVGSAMAKAFAKAGHPLTVWNRTPERAAPFQGRARIAATMEEACAASDVIFVAVLDYRTSNNLLRTAAIEEVVAGKTLVQLMTGTPGDARDVEAWATRHGLAYLDGAIGGPSSAVGKQATVIHCSGEESVFVRQRELLSALGTPTFCGGGIGAAAALNMAGLGIGYSLGIALLHGAALCAAEGIPLEVYFTMTKLPAPVLDECTRDGQVAERPPVTPALAAAAMARPRHYLEAGLSSLNTYAAGLDDMIRASREAGVDTVFLDAFRVSFSKALARGHGLHDFCALYEAFVAE